MTDCPGGSVQRFIRFAKQTDFSTTGTTFKYLSLAQNADDEITQENIVSEGLENVNVVQNTAGTRQSTTSCTFDYQVGRVFELAFGGTTTHAVTTGDVVHTFAVNAVPSYWTIVVGSDATATHASRHKGQLIDSFNITYEINGNVQIEVSSVGNYDDAITSKPAHTALTSQVLTNRNAVVNINSTAVSKVQSANFNISHATEPINGTSGADMQCNVFLGRTVEFTVNAAMNTDKFRDHIKGQDVTDVDLIVDNGVALGSGKRGFELETESVVVTSLAETGSVGSITTFTISGTCKIVGLKATDGIVSADW